MPGAGAGAAPFVGLPTRLKAWIQGYPAMLPAIGKSDRRPEPRRGARTVRFVSVRRIVRMYSHDLVKTAASWAQRPRGGSPNMGERAFASSKEWERVAPPTLKLPPRYSDAYRKQMDLTPNFHPDTGAGSTSSSVSAPSLSSVSSASSATSLDELGMLTRPGEDRFRSLTDLKWDEFEIMGFGELSDDKLQFDLKEGARADRAAKRATLTWQDFSSSGFSRTDAPLNAKLQFSTLVMNTIRQLLRAPSLISVVDTPEIRKFDIWEFRLDYDSEDEHAKAFEMLELKRHLDAIHQEFSGSYAQVRELKRAKGELEEVKTLQAQIHEQTEQTSKFRLVEFFCGSSPRKNP
ncbi:hypothetical protein FOMPIDRAFT_85683 [Fomitopsis schrenkii]|uniref:Uncharacterized protein n=1 Tax=Fomitopsis schrenkii TaxID=2126942 RepID=S8E5B0_FOMSC|nr:hypothetical protein FOMPIDRAFT_85683 [Fomitopsis schrenkii]